MKGTIRTEPMPQLRQQIRVINGKVISFTPEKSRVAQLIISTKLLEYGFEPYPEHTPLKLTITFYRTQSKWNKERVKDALPVRRADLDNYTKLWCDAATTILYADDSQITKIVAAKRWTNKKKGYITFDLKEDK